MSCIHQLTNDNLLKIIKVFFCGSSGTVYKSENVRIATKLGCERLQSQNFEEQQLDNLTIDAAIDGYTVIQTIMEGFVYPNHLKLKLSIICKKVN